MRSKLLLTLSLSFMLTSVFAQRYITEVFNSVTVTDTVTFGSNISVLTGSPELQTLKMDVYEPTGDTVSERPVVVFLHTGSFLPQGLNQQCVGSVRDSGTVAMCESLAKRGYVVAALDYRLGWNPLAPTEEEKRGLLINAVYRAIQDTKTAVRWFRKDVTEGSNQFKINQDKFILMGQGSGGYIALAYATLDDPSEMFIDKFIYSSQTPMVDTSLSGNYDGTLTRPLCVANHVGYSSDVCMVVNMGGALGDSTWIEAGDVPIVAFHVPSDPFAPYATGTVFVPGTSLAVVEVSGSYDVCRFANQLGNNDVFVNANFNDPYTNAANADNNGYEGLFPFNLPGVQAGPWEWWDPACQYHQSGIATNPDMSKTKALSYIDTIMGYACPRMVEACELIPQGIHEAILNNSVEVYPNPTEGVLNISSNLNNNSVEYVQFYDTMGKLVYNETVNSALFTVNTADLAPGLYLVSIATEQGTVVKRVVVK